MVGERDGPDCGWCCWALLAKSGWHCAAGAPATRDRVRKKRQSVSPVFQLKSIFRVRGDTVWQNTQSPVTAAKNKGLGRQHKQYSKLTMPVINTAFLCVQEEMSSFFWWIYEIEAYYLILAPTCSLKQELVFLFVHVKQVLSEWEAMLSLNQSKY